MNIDICRAVEEKADAGRFLGSVIKNQTSYISHGELQLGLAVNADEWVGDLEEVLAGDFQCYGDDKVVIAARDDANTIVGVVALDFVLEGPAPHMTIEDIAIHPDRRGEGIGGQLIEASITLARKKGATEVYLESGLGNKGAHRFFEAQGFAPVSKVFCKSI